MFYCSAISQYPQSPTETPPAIVVLTGGAGRLEAGARLLRQMHRGHLYITGVEHGTTKGTLMAHLDLDRDMMETSVTLGDQARNTAGNARETHNWVQRDRLPSLAVVTAHYHMPRALMELRRVMPHVRLVPVAVRPVLFQQSGHLSQKAKILLGEYHKALYIQFQTWATGRTKDAVDPFSSL